MYGKQLCLVKYVSNHELGPVVSLAFSSILFFNSFIFIFIDSFLLAISSFWFYLRRMGLLLERHRNYHMSIIAGTVPCVFADQYMKGFAEHFTMKSSRLIRNTIFIREGNRARAHTRERERERERERVYRSKVNN